MPTGRSAYYILKKKRERKLVNDKRGERREREKLGEKIIRPVCKCKL